MKKTILLGLAIAGFALNPLMTQAAANDKYPAADFEPSVIYIDKDAVAEQSQDAVDPKYPAANFQPKVVFIDEGLAEQSQEKDEFDAKYPAAYFKPKVIFP